MCTPNPANPDLAWRMCMYGRYTRQVYERPIPARLQERAFAREGLRVAEAFTFHHRIPGGRAMPRLLRRIVMGVLGRVSRLLHAPLGFYQFYCLTKGDPRRGGKARFP